MQENKKIIHTTDATTFLECRRLWDYTSPLRQNLQPSVTYKPFLFGRLIHTILDLYYTQPSDIRQPFMLISSLSNALEIIAKEENTDDIYSLLGDDYQTIYDMIYHYSLWLQDPVTTSSWLHDDNFYVDHTELSFQVPLYGAYSDIVLGGRIDGIITNKQTNETWILEHKTTSSFASFIPSLVRQQQANLYVYAASLLLDKPVVGVIYNLLRKKSPSINKTLKDGSFSQDKSIDTSLSYFKYLLQNNPESLAYTNYSDYMAYLESREATDKAYFMRCAIRKTPKEIATWINQFLPIAFSMATPTVDIYPTPDALSCSRCVFNAPCLHAFKGDTMNEQALLGYYIQRKQDDKPKDMAIHNLADVYNTLLKIGVIEALQ